MSRQPDLLATDYRDDANVQKLIRVIRAIRG